MPCQSGGWDDHREEREELHRVTAFLCAMCRLVGPGDLEAIPGLPAWWRSHQVLDARRQALETEAAARAQQRSEALGRLSPEERRLLGL